MSSYGQMILNSDESKVNDGREKVGFIDTITNGECFNKSQGINQEKENNISGADIPTLETIANTTNQETYAEKNLSERILKNVKTKSLSENKISTENVSATLTERNLANLKPLMLLANHTQQIILKINPILSKSNGTDKNQITKKSVHEKKKPKSMVDKIATEISASGACEIENIKQKNISDDILKVN